MALTCRGLVNWAFEVIGSRPLPPAPSQSLIDFYVARSSYQRRMELGMRVVFIEPKPNQDWELTNDFASYPNGFRLVTKGDYAGVDKGGKSPHNSTLPENRGLRGVKLHAASTVLPAASIHRQDACSRACHGEIR